ncbi:MAG: ABC transporter ATP-binding protein [Acholeplasma sp.]|nr:ABC transporter ATP-binding protein [Acholeplasma sp.]
MSKRKKVKDSQIFKRLLVYLKPYQKEFIISLLLMFLVVLVDLVPSLFIGKIINIIGDDVMTVEAKIGVIITYLAGFVVILGIALTLNYKQSVILQQIGEKIILQVRLDVFSHIEKLSIEQLNEEPVGKMVTRVMNDPDSISMMFTSVVINLIRSALMMVAIIIILFVINVKLALITLAVVPLVTVTAFIFRKFSRKSYQQVRDNISSLNAFLSENLSGMKITQIFNQEDKKRNEFRIQSRKLEKSFQKEILVFAFFRPITYFITMMGLVAVLYFGGKEVIHGVLSYGLLYSFYNYVERFFEPIQQVAEEFNNLQSAYASAEKIFSVLDKTPTVQDCEDAVELVDFKGHIEFKNVWFSYLPDEWVLKDVSFTVEPNETVAFVGATGSGKTTILSLIVRNYDIQKGEILIDGINIKNIKRDSIRKNIGQMLQDVFLFNQSIKDNITLNNDNIELKEVVAASKYVGANSFIEKLPDTYNYMVLERGNNFSSGQRQLISFARAIVYKPEVLILDEATANIDSETEEIIQTSLKKIMKKTTMLIVAHRLSTIQHSDKIIVLHKGEIKESGSHQSLLKQKGMYYNLYSLQFDEELKNQNSSNN